MPNRALRWIMQPFRRTRPERPPLETPEFDEALERSRIARGYAEQSLEKARAEFSWMENALTPPIRDRKTENWAGQ